MDQIESLKQQIAQLQNESAIQTEYLFQGELGNFYFAQRNLELAANFYGKALETAQAMHNRTGEGATLSNLGNVYAERGNTDRAITLYEEALNIARETRERLLEGNIFNNLGLAYGKRGDKARATEYYHDALDIAREIDDQELQENILSNLQLLPGKQDSNKQIDTSEQQRPAQENTDGIQRSTGAFTIPISRRSLYLFVGGISILALVGAIILVFHLQGLLSFSWSTLLSSLLSGVSLVLSLVLWLFLWRFSSENTPTRQHNRARYSAHGHSVHHEIDS